MPDADELYRRGCDAIPSFNDEDPDPKIAEAIRLLGQAAELGHVGAMATLGNTLRFEDGRQEQGLDFLVRAAQAGSEDALSDLSDMATDFESAAQRTLRGAQDGEAWACHVLGKIHYSNLSASFCAPLPEPDGHEAAALYRFGQAAEGGIVRAYLSMANIYLYRGDLDDAARCAELGAAGGYARCWKTLAEIQRERGDLPAMRRAWERSAETGDTEAKYELALILEAESTSDEQALSLLREAADDGVAAACRDLGKRYEEGRGVALDLDLAVSLYEDALEFGNDAEAKRRRAKLLRKRGSRHK